ncbi:MAG: acetaldehyde dehydrogenase, partial [Bacteroidota bacterium]
LEKPACRILVNTQAALGAVGYTNELLPSMTLGPGTFGRSIISDNVSAKHLINIKRLAFETRPINAVKSDAGVPLHYTSQIHGLRESEKATSTPSPKSQSSWIDEIEERIRLKAGNAPIEKKIEKSKSAEEEHRTDKLGEGISKEKVDELMKKFER